jgi:hypothetical protein
VGGPDSSLQYSPIPDASVFLATGFATTPEVEHKSCEVDNRLVHNITRETGRQFECTRKAVKDAGLPYPSLESSLLVLGIVLGGYNFLEVFSILCGIGGREFGDIDVCVVAGRIMGA